MNKQEWLKKNGFDEIGKTYCVFGDSYSIKDYLKENKYIFSPIFKWHCGIPCDLPNGFRHIIFDFDDIYEWSKEYNMAMLKEGAREKVIEEMTEYEAASNSEYEGKVGERLELEVIYYAARGFESDYGYTNVYTFLHGDNVFTWFTTTNIAAPRGNTIKITGTVKKHEEYKGVKTTVLTRCRVK